MCCNREHSSGTNYFTRSTRTRILAKGYKTYSYLLRGVSLDRPNQVWCADITYIPLAKGFLYLVAVMDAYSSHRERRIQSKLNSESGEAERSSKR